MRVPFFDYPGLFDVFRSDYLKIFEEVCGRGAFIMQKDLRQFECRMKEFTAAAGVVGVGNATDALEILISRSSLSGTEVICSTHTMIATASAIVSNGAIPVPVDIGWDGLIDPAKILEAITPNTSAVVVTQLNGMVCEMDEIVRLCESYDLLLFEDAAQALGARYKGVHAGLFGQGGAISFYPAKLLGSFGDAGCVISRDKAVVEYAREVGDHGRNEVGEHVQWGRNSRLDNLQAALLDYVLDHHYEAMINRRRELAQLYDQRLSRISGLTLPRCHLDGGDYFDVYQNYEIQCERRDELQAFLSQAEVGTIKQWGGIGIHQLGLLEKAFDCPVADEFFCRSLLLPMNHLLGDDQVNYVCDRIEKFYGH